MTARKLLSNIDVNKIISLGMIILIFFCAYYLLKIDIAQSPWVLGDWLIHFEDGGFKRRGLSGSIFLYYKTLQDFL